MKNEFYYVYSVDGYAGISTLCRNRKTFHKSVGRNIENFQVLKAFTSRNEAREYEKHLHSIGYEGAYAPRTEEQRRDLAKRASGPQTEERKLNTSKAITEWWKKRKQ